MPLCPFWFLKSDLDKCETSHRTPNGLVLTAIPWRIHLRESTIRIPVPYSVSVKSRSRSLLSCSPSKGKRLGSRGFE
jgi:hypothetical protein